MNLTKRAALILIWFASIFPLLFLVMLALSETWRFPFILADQFGFENTLIIFRSGNILIESIATSLFISLVVSALSVSSAFFISKIISYHNKKQLLTFFAYIPFVLSPVIYAACLNYFFIISELSGTIQGVMLGQFIIIFPYNIILFLSHWNINMKGYSELVSTLGGSVSQSFFKVLIPVSRNILLMAIFQSFLISWFEFGLTNFIGIGQVQTLTIKVYQYIGEANVHLAALSSLLLIIPPVIFLWLNKKFIFHQY